MYYALVVEEVTPTMEVTPVQFSALRSGSVHVSLAYKIRGQCHILESTLEKTATPGEHRNCRNPGVNSEALEAFQQFSRLKGGLRTASSCPSKRRAASPLVIRDLCHTAINTGARGAVTYLRSPELPGAQPDEDEVGLFLSPAPHAHRALVGDGPQKAPPSAQTGSAAAPATPHLHPTGPREPPAPHRPPVSPMHPTGPPVSPLHPTGPLHPPGPP
ncbi:inverted formin-2-like [Hyaena hyaena]|uniref:inverted formin-2-like n=1 Tax=Hyaena hyaena TaxID=95912 RepID=UPI001924D968|nr:inverted formin-2-like [Hyaena hyaena]